VSILSRRATGLSETSPEGSKSIELSLSDRYQEALAACEEKLRIRPDDAEAWYNKGVALDNLNRAAEAWDKKGVILDKLGRHEEALRCFEEAIRIKPDYAPAWDNKGVAVGNLKGDEEALRCFEEALKFDNDYVPAWYHKGVALEHLGRHEEAATIEASLRMKYRFDADQEA
jgi:tetratricopeptide (TPR) repeat protein